MTQPEATGGFTAEETKAIQELFPNLKNDDKLIETALALRHAIWDSASEDGLAPCRAFAVLVVEALRVQEAVNGAADEKEVVKKLFNGLPETIKSRLPGALDSCLAALSTSTNSTPAGPAAAVASAAADSTVADSTAAGSAPVDSTAAGSITAPTEPMTSGANEIGPSPAKKKKSGTERIHIESSYHKTSTRDISRIKREDVSAHSHHHEMNGTAPTTTTTTPNMTTTTEGGMSTETVPAMSASLEILMSAKKNKEVSSLLQLVDRKPYVDALVTHFHEAEGVKNEKALGFAYKLFVNLFACDTLESIIQKWAILSSVTVTTTVTGAGGSNDNESMAISRSALPAGLQGTLRKVFEGYSKLAKNESSEIASGIMHWEILYELEVDKAKFTTEVDKCSTMEAKIDLINAGIKILNSVGIDTELRKRSRGRSLNTHIEVLYRGIAKKKGYVDSGFRLRQRQADMAVCLVDRFGKGVFAILALEGYRSLAQSVNLPAVSILAKWTATNTKAQRLFDYLYNYLVGPVLTNRSTDSQGEQRFRELVDSNDWGCLA